MLNFVRGVLKSAKSPFRFCKTWRVTRRPIFLAGTADCHHLKISQIDKMKNLRSKVLIAVDGFT